MKLGGPLVFQFERLLDLKQTKEQALQLEVARIERLINEIRDMIKDFARLRKETISLLRSARRNQDFAFNEHCAGYLMFLKKRIANCEKKIEELDGEKEKNLAELEQVMRSRKLLEKSRDKCLRELKQEMEKAEEKAQGLHSLHKYLEEEG